MKKLLLVGAIAALGATPVAAAPPTLTLKASPTVASYQAPVTLSGVLSTARAGQSVDIQAQDCGQNALKKIATVNTTTGGNFSATVKPTINTTYQAKQKGATSPAVAVKVSPLLKLQKNGGTTTRRFTIVLTAAQSFVGKFVVLQRRTSTKWRSIKHVTLTKMVPASAPTQLTSAAFSLRLKGHPRLRVVLPTGQAGTCYLAAKSSAVRS